MSRLEGRCEAASYDMSGNCWRYFRELSGKLERKEKVVVDLLENGCQFVHLDDLGLHDFDVLILCKMLRYRNDCAKLLDLNNNPLIGDSAVAYIGKHVLGGASPVNLRSLFLSNCGVSDVGVQSLLAPLQWAEQSMHILELRNNGITDEGAEMLAEALKTPNTHTPEFSLFLNNNQAIGERGVIALAKAVIESQGRLKVWLKDACPHLSPEDKAEIVKFTKNRIRF